MKKTSKKKQPKSKVSPRAFTDWIQQNCPSLVARFNSSVYQWALKARKCHRDTKIHASLAAMEEHVDMIPDNKFWAWATVLLRQAREDVAEKEKIIFKSILDQLLVEDVFESTR